MVTEVALLYFTRTATSEAANKTIAPRKNKRSNLKITSLFVRNTRNILKSSSLPVFEVNELQQVGEGFGERLANAIEAIYEKGFQNVIVVGNDCPQLSVHIINSAVKQLQQHDLVLGPDSRGGVYLIAVNKRIFNKGRFASAKWQTTELLEDIQNFSAEAVSYKLPTLKDANYFDDLIQLKDLLPLSDKLKALVASILASYYIKYCWLSIACNSIHFSIFGLRAPPLSISTHSHYRFREPLLAIE